MRILLVNLAKMVGDSGGLAKVNVAFANEMYQRGHEIVTVYSDDNEGAFFFALKESIPAYNLRHFRGVHHTFPASFKLKREILRAFSTPRGRAVNNEFTKKYLLTPMQQILKEWRPDIIIAFQPAATKALLLEMQTKIPVITMSHGDPADYFCTYPREEVDALGKSAACQVLLPSFVKPLRQHFPNMRVEVIGNVVPQYEEKVNLSKEKKAHKLLFVGRLVRNHKRPHLLVDAFIKIAQEFPNWSLELWGAEDKKQYTAELHAKIQKAHMDDRIRLCGITPNVANVWKQGDIYVFPSAYEGFGLTLAEAMSMGLPAIGYQNCAAVNALIEDGITGFLAADGVDALAEKMKILMQDQNLRIQMGAAAREAMHVYAPEVIWGAWERLMCEVVG